jgi:hypothetical protein
MLSPKDYDNYDQQFVDHIETPEYFKQRNIADTWVKPMRTGKNYKETKHRIPYRILKKDVRWHIATSPLMGIIAENRAEITDMCLENKIAFVENDLEEVMRNLEKGNPVVSYLSNMAAFTQAKTLNVIQWCKDQGIFPYVSINVDEFDTWSLSHAKQAEMVRGHKLESSRYRASMYKFVSLIAQESPFVSAMTATANYEVAGVIDTYGDLIYKVINPLVAGEQIQYAETVAHLGEVTYYNFEDAPLLGQTNDLEKTIVEMLQTRQRTEKATNLKRVIMVQCGNNLSASETGFGKSPNPTEIARIIKKYPQYFEPDQYGIILQSDGSITFNMHNNKEIAIVEKDAMKAVKSFTDDVRILLVKQMAGRGVTLPLVGEIMTCRYSNKQSPLGPVTESWEQFIGRGKSVNVGPAQPDFWSKYGSVLKTPGYQHEANKYNLYSPNTPMHVAGVEKHIKFDACTDDMLGTEIEICPTCGKPGYHGNAEIDMDMSKIDEVLQAAE